MRYLFLILSLASVQIIFGANYKVYPNITYKEEVSEIKTETGKLKDDYVISTLEPLKTENKDEISSKCASLLSEGQNESITSCLVIDENNNVTEIAKPASS